MPESYKLLGYIGVSLGLVFLSLAITIGLFSATSTSSNLTVFYSTLALLFCGLVLAGVGLISLRSDYSLPFRISKQKERAIIEDRIREETREIQEDTNQIGISGTYLIYPNKMKVISKIEALKREVNAHLDLSVLD
jgi:hypothetical protein